jgi:peptidoglycan/LPS O-acetylase OafA/YrhL
MGAIRLMLALAVVFAHTNTTFGLLAMGGELAVRCFFMVSGFYMALILSEKYVGHNARKTFWVNRALKIYPAYWLVLVITIGYTWVVYLSNSSITGGSLGPYTTPFHFLFEGNGQFSGAELLAIAFAQLTLLPLDSLLFLRATGDFFAFTPSFSAEPHPLWLAMFVPPAWTLALEIYFYSLAPFLIRVSLRRLALLLCLTVIVRIYVYYGLSLQHDPWTYRFFPNEFALFLVGFIGYKLALLVNRRLSITTVRMISWTLFFATIVQLLLFSFLPETMRSYTCLATLAVAIPYIAKLSSGWRWDRIIGELSYPIYIAHFFLLIVVRDHWQSLTTSSLYGVTMMIMSLIAAVVIKISVMDPAERRRKKNSATLGTASKLETF